MNAHKDGALKTIGKIYPVLQRNTNVVHSCHLHPVAGADQFLPGGQGDIQREAFLRPPAARCALIGASVTGIEHHGLDPFRFMNSARPKHGLENFADIHHRDQVVVLAAEKREVCEKSDAVDRKLARAGLRPDRTALAPE